MDITPDTKDWTWVLQRECPECGFDTRSIAREEVAGLIRDNAESWREVFAETAPDELRRRPRTDVWSALEYGCHVRDVFRLYDHRLKLMLNEDDPTYPNWDQDATAIEDEYTFQDPETVIVELRLAAEALASSFAKVEGEQWERTGNRSDGAKFTVDTFARYLVHDPIHHLYDLTRTY